ncbi:hypothetical protein BV25DRAFT_1843075 [Artomyces pyxidatus]|uniref:Uncharacterized protein n=1 Tax=Artomyces pyxidatus TaxID=48021 RepID=A0ACB8SHM3_9AGAM|nr:hypothetical protein BV25DRAFT_1843075 [Artomyces pyxidatus]
MSRSMPPAAFPEVTSHGQPKAKLREASVTAAAVLVARSVELALKRRVSFAVPRGLTEEVVASVESTARSPAAGRMRSFVVDNRPPIKTVIETPSDVSMPFLAGTRPPIKIRRIARGEVTHRTRLNVDGTSQGIALTATSSRHVMSPTVKTEGVSKVEEVPLGVRSFELNTSTISQSQEYSQQCMKPHAANIGDFEGREPVASGIGTVGFARRLKFGTPNVGYKATWAALGPPHELQHPTIEQLVSSIPVPLAFTTDVVVSHELHRQTVSHQLSLLETGLLEMSGICQQILEICKVNGD